MTQGIAGVALPENWEWSPLKHATTVLRRGTAPNYVDDGPVRAINQASNQWDGIDWQRTKFHDFSGNPRHLKGYLESHDLVVNSTGTGTLGRVGYFESGPDEKSCIADGHLTLVRSAETILHPRFAYYYLSSSLFQHYLNSALVAGATNQIELNADRLGSSPVPLPTLEEQRRIADFLDAEALRLDSLVAYVQRQTELVDSREESLLHAETIIGAAGRVRVKHLVYRLTSGPRGWGELVSNEGVPFLRIANVPRKGIALSFENLLHVRPPAGPERERSRTCEGDVVVSITADIGSIGLVQESAVDGNVSQHIALLRPDQRVCLPKWLAYSLKAPAASRMLKMSSYGGTKVGLGLAEVAETEIPLPNLSEQRQRVDRIDKAMESAAALRTALARKLNLLAERRQALITAAVTGQLDVTTARP